MKNKPKLNSLNNMHLKINDFISNKKRKKYLLKDSPKNLERILLLKKEQEKEKSNSTTQTGQKNIIINFNKDNENIKLKNTQNNLYENFYNYNSEKRNSLKQKPNLFLVNNKVNRKKVKKRKIFFYNENNNNDLNTITINSKKNKLLLNEICYNSIINDFCKNNNKYFKHRKNDIDMYNYYDVNQRRIEKIIPNINEYLKNNIKKEFSKTNSKSKINRLKIFRTSNGLNNYIFNKIEYRPKSRSIDINKTIRRKENSKNDSSNSNNNKINFCLVNSIISIKNKPIKNSKNLLNNKKNKRDFSCKVSKRRKMKLFEFEKIKLDFNNKKKKLSIGMVNYLSQSNKKELN